MSNPAFTYADLRQAYRDALAAAKGFAFIEDCAKMAVILAKRYVDENRAVIIGAYAISKVWGIGR